MSDQQDTQNFIDLDAVVPDQEVIVRLAGVEHKLVPVSVEDFVSNSKAVEAFQAGDKSVEGELDLVIGMLLRAFPTMTRDMLLKLDLNKLNKLADFAQQHNGQKKVVEEAAAENPPTAG